MPRKSRRLTVFAFGFSFFFFSFSSFIFAAVFEPYGLGARSVGMGNAFVAVSDGYESVFWNPAGIAQLEEKSFHSEYRSLYDLGLFRYITAGYIHPGVGKGTIAFSWYRLDTVGEARFLDYSENTIVFSYGTALLRPLVLGLNGKYYRVGGAVGASGMGLDFGSIYHLEKIPLSLGLTIQDLNRTLITWDSKAGDRLPLQLRVGASGKIFRQTLISTQISWEELKNQSHHVGLEQGLFDQAFTFRMGATQRDDLWRFSWGFGLRFKFLVFDYGWERHRLLGNSQSFSLSFKF